MTPEEIRKKKHREYVKKRRHAKGISKAYYNKSLTPEEKKEKRREYLMKYRHDKGISKMYYHKSLTPGEKWFPVTKKLPDKDGLYLVCWNYLIVEKEIEHQESVITIAQYFINEHDGTSKFCIMDQTTWEYHALPNVTHWMNMPGFPKE